MALLTESNLPNEGPRDGALSLSDELAVAELSHKIAIEAGIGEKQAETAVRVIQEHSLHVGPHPSASEIARYNEIESGLGTRLIENFLAQQGQSMQLNNRVMTIAEKESDREDGWLKYARNGQTINFTLALCFVASALFSAFLLHEYWLAAAFIAAPTIGVVAQFIRGAKR